MGAIQAFVLGRVAADLYPLQARTALEDVDTFRRFVGGFGSNVSTGLTRLGIRTAVLSGVGDDGHGRFLARELAAEGVDTRWLLVHPTLRTALAFCELWPPDRFPLTLYRRPKCPDQEIRPADLPLETIRSTPILYVSGTALANEPSRSAVMTALAVRRDRGSGTGATILDLDWRPESWEQPDQFPDQVDAALGAVDVVIGGDAEYHAAGLTPSEAATRGIDRVFIKRGPHGATLLHDGERFEVPGLRVEVVNGLGAGDAFAAAVGYGILTGLEDDRLLRTANAAGALVTMQLPCAAAMPTLAELSAFVEAPSMAEPRLA